MTYATVKDIRTLTGLGTADVSDNIIIEQMEIADTFIDEEPEANLSGSLKSLASTYFTSYLIMNRLMGEMTTETGSWSIDGVKIDKSSTKELRETQAKNYLQMYNLIVSHGPDKDLIVRVEE